MAIPIDSEMQDPYISLFAVVHCHLLVLCAANFLPTSTLSAHGLTFSFTGSFMHLPLTS